MPTTERPGPIRAELYVREDLPGPVRECRRRFEARLERLLAAGAVDEFDVSSWAKRVPLAEESPERDRYEEFADWADEEDCGLARFFDTRECYSMATGEKRTELVTPAVCLAVYAGDDLVTVAPRIDDDGPTSVSDCLDDLADGVREEPSRKLDLGLAR